MSVTNVANEDAHAVLKDLKQMLKQERKRFLLDHHGRVDVYPPTTQEFQEQWPDVCKAAYPDGVPEPGLVPFSEISLDQVRARLPARSTHTSIAAHLNRSGSCRAPFWQGMLMVRTWGYANSKHTRPGFYTVHLRVSGSRTFHSSCARACPMVRCECLSRCAYHTMKLPPSLCERQVKCHHRQFGRCEECKPSPPTPSPKSLVERPCESLVEATWTNIMNTRDQQGVLKLR